MPDHYIEHAERTEQLADLGLDATGIAETCRQLSAKGGAKKARRVG